MASFAVQRLEGRELTTLPITEAAYNAALEVNAKAPKAAPVEPTAVLVHAPDPTVRILVDLPPFVDTDLEQRRLKAGDLTTLPASIADLLVRRGKAQLVAEAAA